MNICQKKEEHGGKAFIYIHSGNKLLSFTKRNQKKVIYVNYRNFSKILR